MTETRNDVLDRLFFAIGDEILRARGLIARLEDYQRKIALAMDSDTPGIKRDELCKKRF